MKRRRFTIHEIEVISNALGVGFEYKFVWPNGEKIKWKKNRRKYFG